MLKYMRSFTCSILVLFFIPVVFTLSHASQVDINSADVATLAKDINGIGTSKAQAIVDYREANGPFATVDDLVQVQGIGVKTLDRIREFVTLTPATDTASSETSASESASVSSDSEQPSLLAN